MSNELKKSHADWVNAWMRKTVDGLSRKQLLVLFDKALDALWRNAAQSIGEISLEVIGNLAKESSLSKHPTLASIRIGPGGLSFQDVETLPDQELKAGFSSLLTEILTQIGKLTYEAIIPAIRLEILKATLIEPPPEILNQSRKTVKKSLEPIVETGIRNLDAILGGGLLKGSLYVIGGPPGSGKTILSQQISFYNAAKNNQVLFFTTLSEPGAKTLYFLKSFNFFDPGKFEKSFRLFDLGVTLRSQGLKASLSLILDQLKKIDPVIVVIDSFRAFNDLTGSPEEMRKFTYEITIHLMARRSTSLFIGEYDMSEYKTDPLLSIADGLIMLTQEPDKNGIRRFVQVLKMRGASHDNNKHPFVINKNGIEILETISSTSVVLSETRF